MRKGIAFILVLCMVFTMIPMASYADTLSEPTEGGAVFADVNGHWASEAIYKWAELGIVKGDSRGFRPDAPITRAEMAAILDNLMGYQKRASNPFSDVDISAWYADAVLKANAVGILTGDGAGHASPLANITREQAATMLARAFAVDDSDGKSTSFLDKEVISPWARGLIFGMEADKYIGGTSNGIFEPKANITRAQVVTIIDNAVKVYYTKQGTYTDNVNPDPGANCVAIVRADGVVIKGARINGDLIIAEGVAQGNFTLDSTTVTGKLVARGGGENSIHIINGAAVNGRVSIERVDGVVRVVSDGVVIANLDASTEVILEGDFTNVVVGEGAQVEVRGKISNISVEAKAEVTVNKDAKVEALTVEKDAAGAKVEVAGTVTNIKTEAPKTEVIATATAKIAHVEATETATGTNLNIDKKAVVNTFTSNTTATISGDGAPKTVNGSGEVTKKEEPAIGGGLGGGIPPSNPIDTAKPLITAGTVNRISSTEAAVRFTSNEAGFYYFAFVDHNASEPAINTSGAGTTCTAAETTLTISLTAGVKDVYIVVKDSAGNVSDLLRVVVLMNQAAPAGLAGVAPTSISNNDGMITGVNNSMEYKLSTASAYNAVTGNEITGLEAGSYNIRLAADADHYAGPSVTIVVPQFETVYQYALVRNYSEEVFGKMVQLLETDGVLKTYTISDQLDDAVTKGQLIAFGLNENREIGAIDPTSPAISINTGLRLVNQSQLMINSTSYEIVNSAVVFTYNGVSPGAAACSYSIADLGNVASGLTVVSPASVCINGGKVVALLIPFTAINIQTAILQQPVSLTISEGGIANFAITATGSALTYQWQKSTDDGAHFSNILSGGGYSGVNSANLIINPVTYLMNGHLYRVSVNGASGAAISSSASLVVQVSAPTVSVNPSPVTVYEGENASFSCSASGWLTSYQWQVSSNGGSTFDNITNGGIYSGSGSPTLTVSPASLEMNGYLYRLVFYGPGGSSVTSSAALTVNEAPPAPSIIGNPIPVSVYEDGNTTFTVTAAGLSLIYQWQVSTNGGVSFTNITAGSPYNGINTRTLTVSPASLSLNGYQYRAVVNGTGGTSISSSAGLTVNPLLFIISQPVSVTVSEGAIANFSVSAAGIGLGYLSYQWQVSNDHGNTYSNLGMSGIGQFGLGVGPVSGIIHDGLMYRVVITAGGKTVTSNGAELTVDSPPVAPTILTPPVSTTSVALGAANFSVAASSSGQGSLDYQWQVSTNGGSLFSNIANGGIYSGAATPALAINPVSLPMSGYKYRVIVHCSNGLATTSSAVTLTVVSQVAITVNPVSTTVTAGGIASFSVTASGTDLHYNWSVSSNGGTDYTDIFDIPGLSGEHTSTLVVSPAALSMNGYGFKVEVSGFGGSVISSPAALTVLALPDVQLTGLAENLSDDFSPSFEGNVYAYNINAAGGESSINLTPTLDGAVITWDVDTDLTGAQYVTSGSIAAIPLEMGVNIITVHVEKPGSNPKDYVITVSRSNGTDKLTIMVYGDGDNNLENYLLDDIAEMKTGITDDVNLIVLADRAAGYTGRTDVLDGNFEDTRLFRISNGTAIRISGESYFPDITTNTSIELNMGDCSTLSSFIDFCKEYYAADKYMLVLWNHGGGARSLAGTEQEINEEKSICEDEFSGDYLYTAEISDGLTSRHSVDVLGFDACLMGSIEVAYQYGPDGTGFSADTMVASAPNVWGFGWDYEEILSRLDSGLAGQENGETDLTLGGNELFYDPGTITNSILGAIIVEEQRDSTPEDSGQSLAVYDLSLIDDVKNEVDAFAVSLSSAYSTTSAALTIETLRDNALAFFDKTNENEMITTPFYDLYDLADRISSGSADPDVVSQADLVKGVVDQFVLYSFGKFGGFTEGTNGVSIFFPDGDATYIQPDDGAYPHWAYQWWYNPIDTQEFIGPNLKYGKLQWCIDGLTQTTEDVTNWFELMDYWYDDLYNTDWNFYSYVDPTFVDDDTTSSAILLTVDVVQSSQAIYPTGDVDLFRFEAEANTSYGVEVYNWLGGIIPEMSFYDEDGNLLLEDAGAFWFTCESDTAKTYYIKVENTLTEPPYSIGRYDIIVMQQ